MKLAGGQDDILIAISLNNLGSLYDTKHQYDKAVKCHKEALKIKRSQMQEETVNVAASLSNLAMAYDALGQYSKAQKYYQQCIEIKSALFGDSHYKLANLYLNMGGCLFELKQF